jgi:hypothetical protein
MGRGKTTPFYFLNSGGLHTFHAVWPFATASLNLIGMLLRESDRQPARLATLT